MASKDVELRIKAVDNASKSLGDIERALKDLKDAQGDLAEGSLDTSKLLDKLANSLTALKDDIQKLNKLDELSKDFNKVGQSVAKLDKDLLNNSTKLRGLNSDYERVSGSLKDLQASYASANGAFQQQTTDVGNISKAYKKLDKDVKDLVNSQKSLQEQDKASSALEKSNLAALNKQAVALEKIRKLRDEAFGRKTVQEQTLAALPQDKKAPSIALRKVQAPITKDAVDNFKAIDNQVKSQEKAYQKLTDNINKAKQADAERTALIQAQTGQLERLTNLRATAFSQLQKENTTLSASKTEKTKLNKDIGSATSEQNTLKAAIDKTNISLLNQQDNASKTRASYDALGVEVQALVTDLGLVDGSQEAIAVASRKAVAEVNALTEALKRQTEAGLKTSASPTNSARPTKPAANTGDVIAAYRQQVEAIKEAKKALDAARTSANTFAQALGNTAAPSAELIQNLTASRQKVQELNTEYVRQVRVLQSFREEQKRANEAILENTRNLAGQGAQFTETAAKASRLQSVVRQFRGSFSDFINVATGASSALLAVGGQSQASAALLRSLRGQVLSTTTAFLSFFTVFNEIQKVVGNLRTLEAAQSRLNNVFDGDNSAAAKEFTIIRAEAARLGQDFGVLAGEYSKFATAAKLANIDLQVTRNLFISIAEAGRANKLSTEQLERVFLGLTQVLNKGKFQAEEVSQQLGEVLPGAVNILARALSQVEKKTVSVAEVFDRFKTGSVIATQELLVAFTEQTTKAFSGQLGEALDTTTAKLDSFFTNVGKARTATASVDFVNSLDGALDNLNKQLTSPEAIKFFNQLGNALGSVISILSTFAENIDTVILVTEALLALKVVAVLTGWKGSFLGLISSGQLLYGTINFAASAFSIFAGVIIRVAASVLNFASILRALTLNGVLTYLTTLKVSLIASTKAFYAAAVGATTLKAKLIALRAGVGPLGRLIEILVSAIIALGIAFGVEAIIEYANAADEAEAATLRFGQTYEKALTAITKSNGDLEATKERLKDISEVELKVDIETFKTGIAEANLSILDMVENTEGLKEKTRLSLRAIIEFYNAGSISAGEFIARLTEIQETDPGLDKIASELRDTVRESEAATSKVSILESVLALLPGTGGDAEAAIANLNNEMAKSSGAVSTAVQNYEIYNEALKDLIGKTKKGRAELGRLDIADSFNKGADSLVGKDGFISAEDLTRLDELTALQKQASKEYEASLVVKPPKPKKEPKAKISDAQKEAERKIKAQNDFNTKLIQDSADRQFDIKQAAVEDERIKTIAEAKQKAIVTAQREGLQVTQQQIALIEKETGLLFDAENKRKGFEDAEKRVNDLLSARDLIQQQIDTFRQAGDNASIEAADKLTAKLGGVTTQTKAAVLEAIKFAQALGDGNAVLKLETLMITLEQVQQRVALTAREINESLAQGGANAIDSFAQKIAEGVNAFEALGDVVRQFFSDFLRQVAQAIAQQAILNALGANVQNGGGAGQGIAAIIGSLFHTGGVVGQPAQQRAVPANTWKNAYRYHTGGIAGLKPNEIPAILKRNEEVLTESDPRHRNNGGAAMAPVIKVINTIDAGSYISQGLASKQGEQSFMNMLRANKSTIKGILS